MDSNVLVIGAGVVVLLIFLGMVLVIENKFKGQKPPPFGANWHPADPEPVEEEAEVDRLRKTVVEQEETITRLRNDVTIWKRTAQEISQPPEQ